MEKITVLLGGATGYAGQETARILTDHPHVEEVIAFGRELPSSQALRRADAAILALPHEELGRSALYLHALGKTVIDLAASYRQPAEIYRERYEHDHIAPQLLDKAAYGLPELHKDEIQDVELIAAPGCYPTAISLVTAPLIKNGLIARNESIEIDAISGTSGMGKAKQEEADIIMASGEVQPPYKTGRQHRHVGEIEQFLDGRQIDFTTRLGPYFRGITATIDMKLEEGRTAHDAYTNLQAVYAAQPLIRVLPGQIPECEWVTWTDACHIGIIEHQEGWVRAVSVIDNLRKCAGGQGVQALNIKFGFPELAGLTTV